MSAGECLPTMMIVLGITTLCTCATHKIARLESSQPSGHEIYMTHCAGCHGEDGKGKQVAGRELPSADLTRLATRNGGTFPADQVRAILGGLVDIPAHHGPNAMPIYGDIFWAKRYARQRVNEGLERLIDYLGSIQQQ